MWTHNIATINTSLPQPSFQHSNNSITFSVLALIISLLSYISYLLCYQINFIII